MSIDILDRLPVFCRGLLDLVVAVAIVDRVFDRVGQVLLLHPMVRELVRVLVALLALEARGVRVNVLQLTRNIAGPAAPDVGPRRVDTLNHAVGFRRGGKQDRRLRQRQLRFGKSQLHRGIHAGLHDGDRLRVRHADILARRAQKPAAGRHEVARFEETRKVMERRVGVAAAQRLHQRRCHVVHRVAALIIAHRAALRHL